MKEVIFFTNIIPPYRVSLFNQLEMIRKEKNFDFEVFFMSKSEANRDWKVDLAECQFKYRIGNGLNLKMGNYFLHFNPLLIYRLVRSKKEIILGGSWNDFNVLTIILLKWLRLISNKLSIWSEANYLTIGSQKQNRLRDRFRKWVFSQIDGTFVVPGIMSLITFKHWGIRFNKSFILPNLVSENLYSSAISNSMGKKKNEEIPIFLLVARLDEKIKGVLNFLNSIGKGNIQKIILRIAGDGPSRKDYEAFVRKNGLGDHLVFLGNLDHNEIFQEYRNADVFLLPSYTDQSPLVVVEALKCGLPLLVSERCGNHYESVVEGENGYIFNPIDKIDIKQKFELMIAQKNKWHVFSQKSFELANKNFNNEDILNGLINHFVYDR